MPGGVYSALSGMQTRLADLDRLAEDLANVGTAGYKAERATKMAAERDVFAAALESAVDVVGGGTRIDFRPGSIAATGRDLDLAIDGPGFFVVESAYGPRYTRNGSFTRRADGLLTTPEGEPVLGEEGPIRLGPGRITVEEDGTVLADGIAAGRLRVVQLPEGAAVRESGARFRAAPGAAPQPIASRIVGGALEKSNVSMVDRMAALVEVTRAFEALQRGVMVLVNEVDGRAIAEFGRR
jgi:flagellar basal body rod protein FlgG